MRRDWLSGANQPAGAACLWTIPKNDPDATPTIREDQRDSPRVLDTLADVRQALNDLRSAVLQTDSRDRGFLCTPGDGQWIGAAVISLEAHYCSRLLRGGGRIERLYLPLPAWGEIEPELSWGLSQGPLPASSVIAQSLLGGSTSALVRYLHAQPVNEEPRTGGGGARCVVAMNRGGFTLTARL